MASSHREPLTNFNRKSRAGHLSRRTFLEHVLSLGMSSVVALRGLVDRSHASTAATSGSLAQNIQTPVPMRTTPPRPVDIAALFPELAPFARTTTRLHPRVGNPTPQDSSVGGPLLWPVDDPWPYCEEPHYGPVPFLTLADVRQLQDIIDAARGRYFTEEERAIYERIVFRSDDWINEPIAMIPVAQFYAHDIPDLHPPAGRNLLQVLWCPFEHPEEVLPKSKLVWRSSSTVTALLTQPPQPIAVQAEYYVPRPCVVHPEQVIEYPAPLELDEDLHERLREWGKHTKVWLDKVWDGHEWIERENPELASAYYQYELSVAPGWKVGGWGPWSFRDPHQMICTICGARLEPLLTISSGEWDGGSGRWIPIEDQTLAADPYQRDTGPGVSIGRGYNMQIYRCPVSVDHPHAEWMQ